MQKMALSNAICASLGIMPTAEMPREHGQVALANDSLIERATFIQELSTYGIGYGDPLRNNLAKLLQFLAPKRAGGRNVRITQYDENEPWQTVDYKKVHRDPLADFQMVKQRTSTKVSRMLPNKGLTVLLDRDQLAEKPMWQELHTAWLIDLMNRAAVLEALDLYATIATADAWVWNEAVKSNPDMEVQNLLVNVIAPLIGFKPNRAIYGEQATLLRRMAYENQLTAGAIARSAVFTDEELATALGISQALTNAERYQDANGNKVTFLGSKFLLFNAIDQESPEDASHIVRHVADGSYGSGEYAVYVKEHGIKKISLTVEKYDLLQVQHTSGVFMGTVARQ